MIRPRSPATLRGRLTALAVLVTALVLAVVLVVFNVLLRHGVQGDVDDDVRAAALRAATTVRVVDGGVDTLPRDAAAAQVWVFEAGEARLRAPGSPALQDAARRAANAPGTLLDAGREARVYGVALRERGRPIGAVVAAQPLATHLLVLDLALVSSAALWLLLTAGIGGATWALVGRALAPVRAMTQQAAHWSERDLDRRFGTAPRPDELGELAATLDGLLDRLASSLRHARRVSAELSHELRTPLARLMVELDLLQRRERSAQDRAEMYATLTRSVDELDRIVNGLLAAARAEVDPGQGRADLVALLTHVELTWTPTFVAHGVRLVVRPPETPVTAGVSSELLERTLAPLLENAARFAAAETVVVAGRRDGRAFVEIRDDGPGVAEADREAIFELGRRASASSGAGLGLTLARRLADAGGGTLRCLPADRGARFQLVLPL